MVQKSVKNNDCEWWGGVTNREGMRGDLGISIWMVCAGYCYVNLVKLDYVPQNPVRVPS